jgi:uncharacterized membrane protein
VNRLHYAMVADGLLWLSVVLWLIISDAIAREIRPIGAVAEILDKLPTAVSTPIFIVLWFVFLLGWIVLLIFGARPLFSRRSNSQLR